MTADSLSRVSGWRVLGTLPAVAFALVLANAVYIFLVAFGNITDYDTNFAFVQHVLKMDTTNFGAEPGEGLDPDVMWHAIDAPVMWHVGYIGIITWESIAALVLIVASVMLLRGLLGKGFATARVLSTIGLGMILLLFAGGFIAIGGEWFQMWRSPTWNGLDTAFRNAVLAALAVIMLHLPSPQWLRGESESG